IVHIVEDDESTRIATARLIKASGYSVEVHASAAEFLASPGRAHPGCVLLDVQLPDMNGLDLQARFIDDAAAPPVIFISGHGDIPLTARAIQSGAIDFLTKPVQKATLLAAVQRALSRNAENLAAAERRRRAGEAYSRLTPREREVFAHLISGQLNKQ